jgi:hypothetical protein
MRIAAPKHSTTTTNHIDENLLPTPSCPKHHAFPFLNDNRFILSREQRNYFSLTTTTCTILPPSSLSHTVPHHQGQATLSLSTGSSASNLPAKRTGRYQHLATPHHCLSLSLHQTPNPPRLLPPSPFLLALIPLSPVSNTSRPAPRSGVI